MRLQGTPISGILFNNIQDNSEDVNQDGSFTQNCYPHEIRGLNVSFDSLLVTLPSATVPGALLLDPSSGDLLKIAKAEEISTSDANYVRFEITSPYNNLPIPAGTLATLVFPLKEGQTANVNDFGLQERKAEYTAWVKDITDGSSGSWLDWQVRIEDAVFSPRVIIWCWPVSLTRVPLSLKQKALTTAVYHCGCSKVIAFTHEGQVKLEQARTLFRV